MPDVNTQEMTWLLDHIETLIRYVGDSNASQEAVITDNEYYKTHIKERLRAFIRETIDSKVHIERLNREVKGLERELTSLKTTKVEGLERELTSLKTTTDALTALDSKQQGTLKIILQANKARVDAQTAQDEASQFAQIARTKADEARIIAPDALSLQTIMSRAADAYQASENAASSASKAVTAADKATQSVASIEESNGLANLPTEKVEQSENSPEEISTVSSIETQAADGEVSENSEELVSVARSYADEAIKFRGEAQKNALEVKDLASKITQEYDNWSVVQNLFSIAK